MDVASLTCIGVAKQLLASSLQQQYMQAPAWHLKILRTLRATQKVPQFFTKSWSAQQIAAMCACCLFHSAIALVLPALYRQVMTKKPTCWPADNGRQDKPAIRGMHMV